VNFREHGEMLQHNARGHTEGPHLVAHPARVHTGFVSGLFVAIPAQENGRSAFS
jgi:hypothetical protein